MKKGRHVRAIIASAITISLFALLAACGGGGDDAAVAGKSGSIALVADISSIPADGSSSATITATIRDSNGKEVRHFTDVSFYTTLGLFRNGSTEYHVQTQPPLENGIPDPKKDPTGIATAALIAGTKPGVAKVTVKSNNVSQSIYITISGTSASISLSANPASIQADGNSSTTITATLTDSSGNPVTPGTSVTFATGLGNFASATASLPERAAVTANGKSYTVSTPDATGKVSVSLIAGYVPGTTYVVATSRDVSQSISILFTNMFTSQMTIKANPQYIPADGVSTSLVTATVKTVAGTPLQNVPVTFYDANLPSDPVPLPDDNTWKGNGANAHVTPDFYSYSGSTTFTMTYSGSAVSNFAVRLWNSDTMKVAAVLINTTGPVTEQKTTKTLGAGNYYFQVDATGEWEIKVDGSVGPAQAGDPKVLAVTRTDVSGNAQYTYTSTKEAGFIQKIKAETGELSVTDNTEALTATVEITQTAGPPPVVTVTAADSSIYANGTNSTTIEATVFTEQGNIAPDGTVVYFYATSGTIKDATATTLSGKASTTLTSIASTSTVSSTVTAVVGAHSATTTVTFVGARLADMSADPTVIVADGTSTSTIRVYLTDPDGVGVEGETVVFSTTAGTLKITPVTANTTGLQAVTDATGLATVTLISASTAGVATVTAKYGSQTLNTTVTFTGGGGAVASITTTATPSTLPADGESTSDIRAEVKNAQGNPVADGEIISFTITSGTGTLSEASATTSGGFATVTYTAGTTPGSVIIQAMSANFVSGSTTVTLTSGGVGSITLTASPTSIPADGSSSSLITATVKDTTGNPVPVGTTVTFSTTLGTLSSTSVTTTDNTGVVTVSLISSTTAGLATVTATAIGVTQSVTVTFGGDVGSITLTASPTSIPADGSSSSAIMATVRDPSGNPVPAGTTVTFSTTLGTLSSTSVTTTDNTGVVTVSLIAGTTPGGAVVTASSGGVSQSVTVAFTGGTGVLLLAADPASIPADGATSSTITATVKDASLNPVPTGTAVTFTTSLGIFSNASTTITVYTPDNTGVVAVSLIAGTTAGTATVTASSAGVTQTVTVTFSGGATPASLSLGTSQTSVKSDNSDSATITATVLDANNAALVGVTVGFSTDAGQLSASSAVTDANGQARVSFSSGTTDPTDRTATITATVSGIPSESIPIQILGSTLTLTTDTTTLPDNGSVTATLTITAKDAGGNAVFNTLITLSTSGTGAVTLTPSSGNTNVSGQLVVTVAGTSAGSVTVTASGLGTTAAQNYTVSPVGTTFAIVLPTTDPFSTQTRNTASLVITQPPTAITFNDNGAAADTITSAGAFGAFAAGDVIMVGGSTSNDGVYTLSSTVAPTASTLTLVASDVLTTEGPSTTVTVTNGVLVRVRAPNPVANVVFTTTIGVWDGGASPIVTNVVTAVSPTLGYAWAVLTSNLAGTATIQVYDAADSSTSDTITVAFSVPSANAARLTLQSNVYMVAPSIGGTTNTATLTATVRTTLATGSQVVAGAPVAFSIENPTGGGEFVSPTMAITDSAGKATSTFTSGSLSTGAEGLTVSAWVIGEGETLSNTTIAFNDNGLLADTIQRFDGGSFITDGFEAGERIRVSGSTSNDGYYTVAVVAANILTLEAGDVLATEPALASVTIRAVADAISIVIGGTAGSVVIGRGTVIYDVNEATYRLPMSALVTDSNGNPVTGAVVTLSAWPLHYSSGVWYDQDPDPDSDYFVPYITGTFDNEDRNENLILDPGEDTDGNGQLTPPSSSAGGVPVPTEVTTGSNGVAAFDLVYLKASAVWIVTRIRASTLVVGTETTSSLTLRLPAEEEQAKEGLLPDSAYPIGLTTSPTVNATYTFPTFAGTGDTFTTSGNLLAGQSLVAGYAYTYNPTLGTPAVVGDWVWDYISVINTTAVIGGIGAYFPVRIIIQ